MVESKSNIEFLNKKFDADIKRDVIVRMGLAESDFRQLIVWECTVRSMKKDNTALRNISEQINLFLNDKMSYLEL